MKNRVGIVTGASAGIGRATALQLAKAGVAVVISARRRELLDSLANEIVAAGGKALAVPGDAAWGPDIDALVDKTVEYAKEVGGTFDITVVNAGRGLAGGLLSSDDKQWREMYETNVLGAARLMRRVGQHFVDQKAGDIVVLGSVSGMNISPFSGFYGSTKFAIAGMAEAFRREVCSHGVRVTLIKPGIVESEFQGVAGYDKENFYKTVERFGTLLVPEDVAKVICFIVTQPPQVHLNDVVIRPTGQDYP